MESLYHKLVQYNNEDYYPMHMPGHKRNKDIISMINPYSIDITEIDGFDNLHNAKEIIKDGMERAARLYHSKYTKFLVNGSTVGILAAVSACTKKGDTILVARNCHKAVYNAIYLNELTPIYVYPQIEQQFGINGGISPEIIRSMLIKYPNIKAVIITSPTYEGVVSNINKITSICHEGHIPVIVDEAHGAHFGFHKAFPKTSVENGADIVIHSVHKTLPSLTQTALIHINSELVDYNEVDKYLSVYQSSSPSYLLMASIDLCMELIETNGEQLFNQYDKMLHEFNKEIHLNHLKLLDRSVINHCNISDIDSSKIVISTKGTPVTGKELYNKLLERYSIQLEMASYDYVIAMTSIADTITGFNRLRDALEAIDREIELNIGNMAVDTEESNIFSEENNIIGKSNSIHTNKNNKVLNKKVFFQNVILEMKLTPYKTSLIDTEFIKLIKSQGRISAEYCFLYPPGIPLIVPGEIISEELIANILIYRDSGLNITGLEDKLLNQIKVVKKGS